MTALEELEQLAVEHALKDGTDFGPLLERHGISPTAVGVFGGNLAAAALRDRDIPPDSSTGAIVGPALVTVFLNGFELALLVKEQRGQHVYAITFDQDTFGIFASEEAAEADLKRQIAAGGPAWDGCKVERVQVQT